MAELIPAILVANALQFKEKIDILEGQISEAQIDIMDGKFVPQTTFAEPGQIRSFETPLQYELHLMVADPETVIDEWYATLPNPSHRGRGTEATLQAPSREGWGTEATLPSPLPSREGKEENFLPLDGGEVRRGWVKRVIIHAEIKKPLEPIIAKIKSYGWEAGVALNPETPWQQIDELLPTLDTVLVMTVRPGAAGQPFGEVVATYHLLNKILELHEAHPGLIISVDGGVSADTIPLLLEAGATRLIAGSAIWKSKNPLTALQKLQSLTS